MSTTFSEQWYRVADLHLRLRAHVRLERHAYRGEVWHVLDDGVFGRQHRLNPLAWALVARLDGRQSLQQVWDTLVAEQGSAAPTQPEVLALLAQLHEAELVASEAAPDLNGLFEQQRLRQARAGRARHNPLAWRVSLFDPGRLLDALVPLGRALLRPWAAVVWLAAMAAALLAAGIHWPQLQAYGALHAATPRMLLLLWLLYPPVKALHELAHGLAVRCWGGTVREVGVTLMLLVPVPYVDASAASAFAERHRRVLVSLLGIAAELALAALALALWLVVADGVVRDAAFAVLLIGSVSTVLFNGNPLLRMDGYHALADAIESPGLAARSAAWWRWLARRHALGLAQARAPAVARGERRWLIGYGLASGVYRVAISLAIVGWLLDVHLVLGLAALAWLGWMALVVPALTLGRWLRASPELAEHRLRATLVCGLAACAPAVALFAVPLPAATRADGVVWLPEQALVRSSAEGFVQRLLVRDGQAVRAGQPLLMLEEPALPAEVARLDARLQGLDTAMHLALFGQSPKTGALAQELDRTGAERARAQERIDRLVVRAGADGRVALAHGRDLTGTFVARGALLGQVLPAEGGLVRAVVDQDDIDRLNVNAAPGDARPRLIEVWTADHPDRPLPARLLAQTPAATRELPSAVLADRHGGGVPTDPADPQALRTLQPVFTLDLAVPPGSAPRPGTRAWVRFDHGREPLGWQWLRRARQLFIGRLGARPNEGV